jgi:hypothetical protein
VVVCFLLLHLTKMALGRPRPYTFLELYQPLTLSPAFHSLPSGHTAEISGSCLALALWLGRARWALALGLVVAVMGLSRLYLLQHYPSDVFFGWMFGALSGFAPTRSAHPRRAPPAMDKFLSRLFRLAAWVPLLLPACPAGRPTLPALDSRALWFSDEIRYANVFENVIHGGKWLVMYLNGVPYPDKPPVYFWFLTALLPVYKAAGPALFMAGRRPRPCCCSRRPWPCRAWWPAPGARSPWARGWCWCRASTSSACCTTRAWTCSSPR